MKKTNVAVTGYIGSGSSAVIDFLKEFECCGLAYNLTEPYEHVAFYSKGGLYEMGSLLMSNVNTAFNSDMIINDFISCTYRLNDNDFGWFGSYRKLTGDKFKNASMELVDSISQKTNGKTANHYIKTKFSFKKVGLQLAAKIVYKRKIHKWGREYIFDKKETYFSLPTKEEFVQAAKQYTNAYFEMSQSNKSVTIYDHLIWPNQIGELENYFDNNLKVIVVERDARDMYNLNKNYWYDIKNNGSGKPPLFPTDTDGFCQYWEKVAGCKKYKNPNVLYINFEDLIYNYDNTTKLILEFLEIPVEISRTPKKFFNPTKSIHNTQTFLVDEEWKKESELIYKKMINLCYEFPLEIKPEIQKMFDESN